jgi:DNA-binding CsgD family transcriptional regulator
MSPPRSRKSSSHDGMRPTARTGRCIFSPRQWQGLADSLKLSDRELQSVQCIFDDQTELAIARELRISAHTVHTHLERLYRKLGVTSRCAAVVRVLGEYVSSEQDLRSAAVRSRRPVVPQGSSKPPAPCYASPV